MYKETASNDKSSCSYCGVVDYTDYLFYTEFGKLCQCCKDDLTVPWVER